MSHITRRNSQKSLSNSADPSCANLPTVSVVIPTRNRPDLVLRAVRSALAQTLSPLEIIVVVDGRDPFTVEALRKIGDKRLQVVELESSVGASEARNRGVQQARGEWVAMLDDDDEWLAMKLEKQVEAAEHSPFSNPILSSRFFARSPKGVFEWPRRLPADGEPLSEYLFARRSLLQGEAFFGTTFLTRRRLLLEVPFTKGLARHQDSDWVLRASARQDTGVEFLPECLLICDVEQPRPSVGNSDDWRRSLEWIRSVRHLVTKRAYAGFLLTFLNSAAADKKDWSAAYLILKDAVILGRPSLRQLELFLAMWVVPRGTRRWLRAIISKRPHVPVESSGQNLVSEVKGN